MSLEEGLEPHWKAVVPPNTLIPAFETQRNCERMNEHCLGWAKLVVNLFWQQQVTFTSYEIQHIFKNYVRNNHVMELPN